MTQTSKTGPRVPTEKPDPKEADRNPRPGSKDRPGFDLGGSVDESKAGSDSGSRPTHKSSGTT